MMDYVPTTREMDLRGKSCALCLARIDMNRRDINDKPLHDTLQGARRAGDGRPVCGPCARSHLK